MNDARYVVVPDVIEDGLHRAWMVMVPCSLVESGRQTRLDFPFTPSPSACQSAGHAGADDDRSHPPDGLAIGPPERLSFGLSGSTGNRTGEEVQVSPAEIGHLLKLRDERSRVGEWGQIRASQGGKSS